MHIEHELDSPGQDLRQWGDDAGGSSLADTKGELSRNRGQLRPGPGGAGEGAGAEQGSHAKSHLEGRVLSWRRPPNPGASAGRMAPLAEPGLEPARERVAAGDHRPSGEAQPDARRSVARRGPEHGDCGRVSWSTRQRCRRSRRRSSRSRCRPWIGTLSRPTTIPSAKRSRAQNPTGCASIGRAASSAKPPALLASHDAFQCKGRMDGGGCAQRRSL